MSEAEMMRWDDLEWSGETYLATIEAIKAVEPIRSVCARLGISVGVYGRIGKLAFGGDGFNHYLHELRTQAGD